MPQLFMPTPRHGSSSIISFAQRASSTRVFLEASGAFSNRSMMRGSMSASPASPTAAIGTTRAKTRRIDVLAPTNAERANVTANETGIMANAPREYVLTMQADAATNAKVLSLDFFHPSARK